MIVQKRNQELVMKVLLNKVCLGHVSLGIEVSNFFVPGLFQYKTFSQHYTRNFSGLSTPILEL